MAVNHTHSLAQKRKLRVRGKLHGTAERPRLTIYRSNKYTYLQAIDDVQGLTVASAHDKVEDGKKTGTKTERARQAAEELGAALQKAGVKKIVIDRGQYKYHGRVKAVAEAIRATGIEV
jgi:large subunit ribosomal protein L18